MYFCFVFLFPRGSKEKGIPSAGTLSSRRFEKCDHNDSVHNETQTPVDGRGVQTRKNGPADHFPQPKLHGPVTGARTKPPGGGVAGRRLQERPPVPVEQPPDQRRGLERM